MGKPGSERGVTGAGTGSEVPRDTASSAKEAGGDRDAEEPSPFPHPPWTVSLVLVAGVITLVFGILVSPIWLVVGSPFVIALFLWLWVRLIVRPDDAS